MRRPRFNSLMLGADCPMCETESAIHQQRIVDLKGIGRLLKFSTLCERCHYSNMEFIPFNVKKPSVVRFSIKNKIDLDAKVIKSQSCTFKIPELGVEVGPGPESHAEIMNVDGVLSSINLALEYEYGSNKLSKVIERIKKGKGKVTLVLDDPLGVSRVIPNREF